MVFMTTIVVGATGATGRLLVQQLLDRGGRIRAVVRSADRLLAGLGNHPNLEVTEASLLSLSDDRLRELVAGCGAVASCLGHNLTFRGIWGSPQRLVTDAVRRLCEAVQAGGHDTPVKFVLMSSAGVRHQGLAEPVSLAQRAVVGLIRTLVPPHADNERAAEFLRTEISADSGAIEWAVVRPDSLTDADAVTPYETHASPTRSAIFDPGKTSRINVAHFMAELVTSDAAWDAWQGRMPVIYNQA